MPNVSYTHRYQQGVKQKHIKNEHNYEIRRNLFLQTKKV